MFVLSPMRRNLAILAVAASLATSIAFAPAPSRLSLKNRFAIPLRTGRRAPNGIAMQQATQTTRDTKKAVEEQLTKKNPIRPPIGLIDLATKYNWGMQDPKIPLPYSVIEGQPPEHCDKITQEHLDCLARDGAVLVRGVLDQKWIDYLREVTEWQIKHPHVWAIPGIVSNLYDYIQRSAWTTNTGFANFMYYSPVASVLGQMASCGWFPEGDARGYHEIRISTDLVMVNPNKGFKWHQDNQNGPLTSGHGGKLDALRYWVTMDDTPADYGAPVYLKGSHRNVHVGKDEVFVNLEEGDLPEYKGNVLEFRPKAGDMLIWHPRSIHKVDGAPGGDWGNRKRRVLGGTVAVDDALYQGKKKALFSDMGDHGLQQDDPLKSPYFPIIYPQSDPAERAMRASGKVGRSFGGFMRMVNSLISTENLTQFSSWTQVINEAQKVVDVNKPFLTSEEARK